LVGINSATIAKCYSVVDVAGTTYVGGFIGSNTGTAGASSARCLWDRQIQTKGVTASVGQGSSGNIYNYDTLPMKQRVFYGASGWDFNNTWMICDFVDYPRFRWQGPQGACKGTYSGGEGSPGNPFRISTVADWQELMATPSHWSCHFVLMNDIDLEGVNLMPVGRDIPFGSGYYIFTPFTGAFDGNGHIIRNAAINQPESVLAKEAEFFISVWKT
jgi:hypothetical protein